MGKQSELLFNVPVGIFFWDMEEHEPMIVALFLPIIYRRNWKGPWKIKVSYWVSYTAGEVHTYFKSGWDSQ